MKKTLRIVGLSLFTIVATSWVYLGTFNVVQNTTLVPALLFGAGCMFGFIVVALHNEVFE